MANTPLIQAQNLSMSFEVGKGLFGHGKILKAVDNVTLTINRGETFGLVGESGCGKTTVGRALVRLYEPTGGQVLFDGKDIAHLSPRELMPYRPRMQMIFQDPYASLDPRKTVADLVKEPMILKKGMPAAEKQQRAANLLETVGLKPDHLGRYPHEFSGGQRQRIGIARALSASPDFIVCDEPISALDVSIQAQVVNMLEELQESLGLTYLFVSHDLSMVKHIAHRVGVMYLGQLVEMADTATLFSDMRHPYTKALLSAVPVADPDIAAASQRVTLTGDVPSPLNPPSGCPFRTRCPQAMPKCAETRPVAKDVGAGHMVSCHLVS